MGRRKTCWLLNAEPKCKRGQIYFLCFFENISVPFFYSTLPATGYRYMRYKNDDGTVNRYVDATLESKSVPTTYIGFDKYDTGKETREKFQVKGPEVGPDENGAGSWSDARLRGRFDTLQLYVDGVPQARIPHWKGDKGKSKLEPFADAYPEYGEGGARQVHLDGRKVEFDEVEILPKD